MATFSTTVWGAPYVAGGPVAAGLGAGGALLGSILGGLYDIPPNYVAGDPSPYEGMFPNTVGINPVSGIPDSLTAQLNEMFGQVPGIPAEMLEVDPLTGLSRGLGWRIDVMNQAGGGSWSPWADLTRLTAGGALPSWLLNTLNTPWSPTDPIGFDSTGKPVYEASEGRPTFEAEGTTTPDPVETFLIPPSPLFPGFTPNAPVSPIGPPTPPTPEPIMPGNQIYIPDAGRPTFVATGEGITEPVINWEPGIIPPFVVPPVAYPQPNPVPPVIQPQTPFPGPVEVPQVPPPETPTTPTTPKTPTPSGDSGLSGLLSMGAGAGAPPPGPFAPVIGGAPQDNEATALSKLWQPQQQNLLQQLLQHYLGRSF